MVTAISNTGEKVAYLNGNNIEVKDIDKDSIYPNSYKIDTSFGFLANLTFSPSGKFLLAKYYYNRSFNYKYKLFELSSNDKNGKQLDILEEDVGQDITFLNDNDFLVEILNKSIYLIDCNAKKVDSVELKNFPYGQRNQKVSISADWKSLLVYYNSYDSKTILYRKQSKDSIFNLKLYNNEKNNHTLYANQSFSGMVDFVSNKNLIGISFKDYYGNNNNFFSLWNFYTLSPILSDRLNKLNEQLPDLSFDEKVIFDIIDLDTITDNRQFVRAVDAKIRNFNWQSIIYNSRKDLKLFKHILGRAIIINPEKYINYFKQADSLYFNTYGYIRTDTLNYVNELSKIVSVEEKLLDNKQLDSFNLSNDYWKLSRYHLFLGNYDSVIIYSNKGLKVQKINDGILTNLALGYLFTGKYNQADSIYHLYRGKNYLSSPYTSFTTQFKSDLQTLEGVGIISPKNELLYRKVNEIKKYLNE